MPWYCNPVITCRVLNKIANRYQRANLQELKTNLDYATQLIWNKQEYYYKRILAANGGASGLIGGTQ
jgi:hypothetical protein